MEIFVVWLEVSQDPFSLGYQLFMLFFLMTSGMSEGRVWCVLVALYYSKAKADNHVYKH